MSFIRLAIAFVLAFAIGAAPALAAHAISIDAPGDMLLFVLGVSGLLIGRQISKRRRKGDNDRHG
jgi:hypothetical protein